MPKVTICGIPGVRVMDEREYGGGKIYPGAMRISRYARISKPQAQKLIAALGISRLPRMGYEMTLCEKTVLENTSGRFSVGQRTGAASFQGARRRRRKR